MPATTRAQDISNKQRDIIVEKILETIEEGNLNWNMGWNPVDMTPRNPCTKNRYKGVNQAYLAIASIAKEYNDPRWVTMNNIKQNGWHLQKGSKAEYVEKWAVVLVKFPPPGSGDKPDYKDPRRLKPAEIEELLEQGYKKIAALQRVIPVFNASCVDGMPPLYVPANKAIEGETEKAYALLDEFKQISDCRIVEEPSEGACYIPALDEVRIPLRDQFKTCEDLLATTFHELGHSTGHPKRLNREIANEFGSEKYAKEELVAELSSVFTQAALGIDKFGMAMKEQRSNAAYLQSWAKRAGQATPEEFKNVKRQILSAVGNASKASELVMKPYLERHPEIDLDPNIEKTGKEDAQKEEITHVREDAPRSLAERAAGAREAADAMAAGHGKQEPQQKGER